MVSLTEKNQAVGRFVHELILYVRSASPDAHPVLVAAGVVDPAWMLGVEPLLELLLKGDEQAWADVLSRFVGKFRYLERAPRIGMVVDRNRSETIDVYESLKAASPFAGVDLWFTPPPAEVADFCEEALHRASMCSQHDDFAFEVLRQGGQVMIRPIWIRAKPGSRGAETRDGPLMNAGQIHDIFA